MSIVIIDRPLALPRDKPFFEAMAVMNDSIPMCIKIDRDKCWRARLSLKFWRENQPLLTKAGFIEVWTR